MTETIDFENMHEKLFQILEELGFVLDETGTVNGIKVYQGDEEDTVTFPFIHDEEVYIIHKFSYRNDEEGRYMRYSEMTIDGTVLQEEAPGLSEAINDFFLAMEDREDESD